MNSLSLIKLIIYVVLFSFLFGMEFVFHDQYKEFFKWNQNKPLKFWLVACIGFVYSLMLFFVPFYAFPIGFLALLFVVFSNRFIGLCMYGFCMTICSVLFLFSNEQFLAVMLSGMLCSIVFSFLLTSTKLLSVLAYAIFDFGLYFTVFIFEKNNLSFQRFMIYSIVRCVVLVIILFIIIKLSQEYLISINENFYVSISEPDYELMLRLKEINEAAYYHAIHTSYLADRISTKIKADNYLAKALGCYHRIGLLQGDDTIQNTLTVAATYHFPAELQNAMKEYGIKNTPRVSKEAAIVQLCDAFVSSLTYVFQKDVNAEVNYEKIIDVIIKKKLDYDDLTTCDLSLYELSLIKKAFTEERVYYDFLRR